jgi:hypothetical protein
MNNHINGRRVVRRWVRVIAVIVAAGVVALAGAGSAAADPLDSCPPGAMMRAQADQMNLLANFLAAHPNAGNSDSPEDTVAALQMVAGLRNIQAGMADSCGITMDQLVPPGTNLDQLIPPGALPVIPPGR